MAFGKPGQSLPTNRGTSRSGKIPTNTTSEGPASGDLANVSVDTGNIKDYTGKEVRLEGNQTSQGNRATRV